MQLERRVHKDTRDVDARLAELGLTQDLLLQAAQRGLAAFAACTPHHPKNYPALASWAETFRGLSDLLVVHPYRWTKLEDNGQPQVHNPSGLIALTVAGGDTNTGRIGDAEPKTSASKGDTTSKAMLGNAFLFPEMEADARTKLDTMTRRQTWFLLVHRDLVAGEMRCELSMPISMSEDRRIDGWAERILLGSTSFDAALLKGIPDEPTPPVTDEVKIELKRRA
jgi:hypothetical protein